MVNPIIKVTDVTKEYPGTIALSGVNMEIYPGEVHTLAGENGAGKSTLMKILAGAISPTIGSIEVNGEKLTEFSPRTSSEKGIGIIYQEFNLVPHLTVEENIMLGKEKRKGLFVRKQLNTQITKDVLEKMNIKKSTSTYVKDLGVADQQLVEIAKAISQDVNVLIMDEPTAALTSDEVESLFKLMRSLKENGVAIIYISHKFEEIFEISDKVTVLRDGNYIATKPIEELDYEKLVKLMVGRELTMSSRARTKKEETILIAENLFSKGKVANISFDLKKGEVLGVAGLLGSGRTELAKVLYGLYPITSGTISVKGKTYSKIDSPEHALKIGIGLIPEDRKKEGVVLGLDCEVNTNLGATKKNSRGLFLDLKKEKSISKEYKDKLSIKYYDGQLAGQLSGGNQQKVVIAKALATDADILIFDEPTRGVDIGAKQEIYNLMNELLREGKSIIMISSEMGEILNLSDRIAVMKEGELAGILPFDKATQENIFSLSSGISKDLEGKT
ncbi:D-xylose ABC transporter ATP-binding protein [Salipaludibacillus neizhouensis]|uniref:D-xylose ABC transporter ATP-binding protein n=1 Tax=Salipaludibacillus neizhouensis TaxID=885475 RepID=A0A3A9KHC7_9BACI|nr:sugar ABC transporter ATP-binding protein [Salipaludibacillus neizhouensis]RKL67065.1 D-xylose ABC transporter ATP-binding protein [Salipaludibacillus neizhouensis]